MTTNFSFEVPHAHLEDFSDLQDFYFALSCFCNNTKYKSYFLNRAINDDKSIWLDNSWNETGKADDPITLTMMFRTILADKVFSPDDISWDKRQLDKAFNVMANLITVNKIIVVIKSIAERNWLSQSGAKHFAIPFRYRLTQSYDKLCWCKDYHFLGMNHITELKELRPPTVDTSMPIRMALHNLTLDEWVHKGCPRYWYKDISNYYDLILTNEQVDLARNNILRLKEMVNGK